MGTGYEARGSGMDSAYSIYETLIKHQYLRDCSSTCISQRSHSCPSTSKSTGSMSAPSLRLPIIAYDHIHVIFVHVNAQQAEKKQIHVRSLLYSSERAGRNPSRSFFPARVYGRGMTRLNINVRLSRISFSFRPTSDATGAFT
jgi:hypothetical protein